MTAVLDLEKPFDQWGASAFEKVRSLQGDVARAVETRRTLRFEMAGHGYYVKYHKGLSVGELVKNLLTLRMPIYSAKNEWQAVRHLSVAGVDTLKAVGYGYRGVAPLWTESFLITEELTDCINLGETVESGLWDTLTIAQKRDLLRLFAETVRGMHRAGVNHRDCYLCHFLWQRKTGRLFIIDLHRSQIRDKVPERWLIKDLASLYFSARELPVPRTYFFRFLKIYLPGEDLRRVLDKLTPVIRARVKKMAHHHKNLVKKRGFS